MNSARGALVVLPSEGGDLDRLLESLQQALAVGRGDFESVTALAVDADGSAEGALRAGVTEAMAGGFDWLLAVSTAETLAPNIFATLQPALRVHEAIWGGAAIATPHGAAPKLERVTRLAAQDISTFFHAALRWWIGPSHFVRPARADEALRRTDTSAWYADYMLNLWRQCSSYKTAQCLTHFHGALPPLPDADRARLIASLEAEPVFARVRFGQHLLALPYTGLNPVIEREQVRGLFFENEELAFLAARLPRGLRVVDAGANTGNHTVFFAAVMEAETVIPIEPLPRAAAAIRAAVAENRLTNVDLSLLGIAIGAEPGMLRAVPSVTAGLGATHFVADAAGTIPRTTLDRLIEGRIDFLKLDVEGMEMQALAGAEMHIAVHHPTLYVEVVDESVGAFMSWADLHGYQVEKLFPDKTHCNYLLFPTQKA